MSNYVKLTNNLELLKLEKIKENIDQYIDLINNKKKDVVDALYELTNLEIELRNEKAIYGCVRKKEGCICVDMECSAISALAQFRNKEVFQFFYAADNLDSAKWDQRSLGNNEKLSDKETIGLLAIKFASTLNK